MLRGLGRQAHFILFFLRQREGTTCVAGQLLESGTQASVSLEPGTELKSSDLAQKRVNDSWHMAAQGTQLGAEESSEPRDMPPSLYPGNVWIRTPVRINVLLRWVGYQTPKAPLLTAVRLGLNQRFTSCSKKSDTNFYFKCLLFFKVKRFVVHRGWAWWHSRSLSFSLSEPVSFGGWREAVRLLTWETHLRVKPKWICCQPADYHPGLSTPASVTKTKTGQPRATSQDKSAYRFPSLPVSFWLYLRLAGTQGLLGVDIFSNREKPHIFHKFVFRMNFTVESSSIAEYVSQRGNKTFSNKLSPPREKMKWALCQYVYDKENILVNFISIIFCLCKLLPPKNVGCLFV